jgi:CBS-domain-containing membrane protein
MDPANEQRAHLPVRTRRVVGSDEAPSRSVHCLRRGEAVSLDACAGCTACEAMPANLDVPNASVACSAPIGERRPGDPSLDLREAMLRTTVGELLSGVTACVRPETALHVAVGLLSHHLTGALPVVDGEAKLVGILSKSDVVRGDLHGRAVADAMTPVVHALPEDAPLSFAVGLLAGQNLNQTPVVGHDGQVLGMFTANDALRWVARAIGYVF